MQDSGFLLVIGLFKFIVFLFSLSVHECAHAWMASRLGDHTARMEGRITLNPSRHIDAIGTLLFPILMIFCPIFGIPWFGGGGNVLGWGRPVPVMTRNLKRITRDDNLIALAGPAANLLLSLFGFIALLILILFIPGGRGAAEGRIAQDFALSSAVQAFSLLAWLMVQVNLALFFFNFLPIPPLDGSRILRNLLPYNALNNFDAIGRFTAILIFLVGNIFVNFFMQPVLVLVVSALSFFIGQR